MSKLLKLLERIKSNPKTVRFEELDKLLTRAGFRRRQPRSGSSHYIYVKDGKILTVPYDQPHIKQIYIEKAIEAIGDYFEE
jgi:hypothetical protein